MLRAVFLILCATLFTQPAFAESARPETAKYVKAYSGQEGAQIWTLRIGARADNEALVQIERVDHELDKRILRCKVQPTSDGGKSYSTKIDGKDYVLLRIKNGSGELYLPGTEARYVAYNDGLSQNGDAQAFLTSYLEQDVKK
ncbi:hypothetical protein [Atlantibacter hermannii]|uniref:hypothetical protein n=1 Tax=Atlantibacter hermannii TaxID=565 RepID=UPI0028AE061B|nr:hypothetical protein [Atlantibacter hermannii]